MSLFDELIGLEKHTVVVPAEDSSLRGIVDFVLKDNDITEQKYISNISVITEEAFVNVAHYSGSKDCTINVYHNDEYSFFLEFIDSGSEFDPLGINKDPYNKNNMNNRIGGLGILIIKKMSLAVDYKYQNDQNHLLIKIKRRD